MDESTRKLADSIADRYEIVRELGAGGMARVHLAKDLRHGREVAIKVMRPELSASLGSERFQREIRLLAHLQHPHILGLVDSGETGGVLYYVMPYLAGGSLRARLERDGELPLDEALMILREIAEALAHAHAEGIVHRDIKPENVLFSAGHVQVADFGIARFVDVDESSVTLTATGVVVGSPPYMAPEQVTGGKADSRTDLYALGALAYEMIAGAPPFTANQVSKLMAMHVHEEPVPLSRRRSSVSAKLDALVMRCLQKRPADRLQSARDLLEALDHLAIAESEATRTMRAAGTVASQLRITGALASRLDRSHFDPRMIGDSLDYLDNLAESDVLVMLMNAAWLDGSDLEPHLRQLPYRCIAPTLYGFGPHARNRFELSLEDHLVLLSELLSVTVEQARPSLVLVGGFSSAGDVVLRMAAGLPDGTRAPDGVLALGCNQAMETCFVSRVLAGLHHENPAQLLRDLCAIGEAATSLDDWIVLNGYMGRIMTNFRSDLAPLRMLARQIIEPYVQDDAGAFAAMYREASARVKHVRCVFEDSEVCNRLLRAVLVDHMDRGSLGPHHRDGSMLIEPTESHFELLEPDRVAAHLAAMVADLRGPNG